MNMQFFAKRVCGRWVLFWAVLLLVGGCASIGSVDNAQATRQRTQPLAQAGDAQAQYELGNSYCCGSGFYRTELAIEWWCRAATQGHSDALERLRLAADRLEELRPADRAALTACAATVGQSDKG